MSPQGRRSMVVQRGNERSRRHRPDYIVVLLSVLLMVLGLIVIYAISPGLVAGRTVSENYYISKQVIAIGLGIVAFIVTAAVPVDSWRRFVRPLVIAAGLAAVATQLFGEEINGAYRWITIGGVSFQAAELIKFALVVWLAGFLTDRISSGTLDKTETFKPLVTAVAIIGVVVAGLQSDLGSTGVMVMIIAAMCYVAGLPLKRVALFGGIVLLGTAFAIAASPYRRERVMTFINPEKDCQTIGYQACQAHIAIGSGGMFGKGLAHGGQAFGYLPEAANDSIFAILAEKFGFVGVTFVIIIFMGLFAKLKSIAERASDNFARLLVVGALAWLSTQTFINIGAMIGLLPLKGITLPFISYGGTSIVFVAAIAGIVFNISRYTTYGVSLTTEGRAYDNPAHRRGDRRAYYAPLSRR